MHGHVTPEGLVFIDRVFGSQSRSSRTLGEATSFVSARRVVKTWAEPGYVAGRWVAVARASGGCVARSRIFLSLPSALPVEGRGVNNVDILVCWTLPFAAEPRRRSCAPNRPASRSATGAAVSSSTTNTHRASLQLLCPDRLPRDVGQGHRPVGQENGPSHPGRPRRSGLSTATALR